MFVFQQVLVVVDIYVLLHLIWLKVIMLKFNVKVLHQKMKDVFNGFSIIEYVFIFFLFEIFKKSNNFVLPVHILIILIFFFLSFLMMNNHFIHVVKLFIFVLFQELIWAIIVVQFRVVVMQMQIVFLHLEVVEKNNKTN